MKVNDKNLSLLRSITKELLCLHYAVRGTQHLGSINKDNHKISNQKDNQTLATESRGRKLI